MPALYNLALGGFLPAGSRVVGFARRDLTDEQFREHCARASTSSAARAGEGAIWDVQPRASSTTRGDFADLRPTSSWRSASTGIDRDRGTAGNRLFYLATPPNAYPAIVAALGARRGSRTPASAVEGARLDAHHRREAVRLRPGTARER